MGGGGTAGAGGCAGQRLFEKKWFGNYSMRHIGTQGCNIKGSGD
jgi:hypothetical protein